MDSSSPANQGKKQPNITLIASSTLTSQLSLLAASFSLLLCFAFRCLAGRAVNFCILQQKKSPKPMLGTHCFKTGLSPMAVGLCAGAEPAAQCARGHPLHLLLTKAFNCMSPSARAGSCRRCLGNARKIWLWHSVALFYLLYCSKNIWPLLKRARLDAYITACSRNSTCWLAQFLQLSLPFSSAACPRPRSAPGKAKCSPRAVG